MSEDTLLYYQPYHYNIRQSQNQYGKSIHIKITSNSNMEQIILKQTYLINKLKQQRNRYTNTIEQRNNIIKEMIQKMKQYQRKISILCMHITDVLGEEYLVGIFDQDGKQKYKNYFDVNQMRNQNQRLKEEIARLRKQVVNFNNQQTGDIANQFGNGDEAAKFKEESQKLNNQLQIIKIKYNKLKKERKALESSLNDIEAIEIQQQTIMMSEVQCQTQDFNQIQQNGNHIRITANFGNNSSQNQQPVSNNSQFEKEIKITELELKISQKNILLSKLIEQKQSFEKQKKIQTDELHKIELFEKDELIEELKNEITALKSVSQMNPYQSDQSALIQKDKEIEKLRNEILSLKQTVQNKLQLSPQYQQTSKHIEIITQNPPVNTNIGGQLAQKEKYIGQLKKKIQKLKKKEKKFEKLKEVNQKLTTDLQTLQFQQEVIMMSEVQCQTQEQVPLSLTQNCAKINAIPLDVQEQNGEQLKQGYPEDFGSQQTKDNKIAELELKLFEKDNMLIKIIQQNNQLKGQKGIFTGELQKNQLISKDQIIEQLKSEIQVIKSAVKLKQQNQDQSTLRQKSKEIEQLRSQIFLLKSTQSKLLQVSQNNNNSQAKEAVSQSVFANQKIHGQVQNKKVIDQLQKQIHKLKKKQKKLNKLKQVNQKLTTDLQTLQFQQQIIMMSEVQCQTQFNYQTQIQAQSKINSQPESHVTLIFNLNKQLGQRQAKICQLQNRIKNLTTLIVQLRQQSDSIVNNLAQKSDLNSYNRQNSQLQRQEKMKCLKDQINMKNQQVEQNKLEIDKYKEFIKQIIKILEISQNIRQINGQVCNIQKLRAIVFSVLQRKLQNNNNVNSNDGLSKDNYTQTYELKTLQINDLNKLPLLYIQQTTPKQASNLDFNFKPIFISNQNMMKQHSSAQIKDQQQSMKQESEQKPQHMQKSLNKKPNLTIQTQFQLEHQPQTPSSPKIPLLMAPASPRNTITFMPLLARTEPYHNANSQAEQQFLIANLKLVGKPNIQKLINNNIERLNTVLSQVKATKQVRQKNVRDIVKNMSNQVLCEFFNKQSNNGNIKK